MFSIFAPFPHTSEYQGLSLAIHGTGEDVGIALLGRVSWYIDISQCMKILILISSFQQGWTRTFQGWAMGQACKVWNFCAIDSYHGQHYHCLQSLRQGAPSRDDHGFSFRLIISGCIGWYQRHWTRDQEPLPLSTTLTPVNIEQYMWRPGRTLYPCRVVTCFHPPCGRTKTTENQSDHCTMVSWLYRGVSTFWPMRLTKSICQEQSYKTLWLKVNNVGLHLKHVCFQVLSILLIHINIVNIGYHLQ